MKKEQSTAILHIRVPPSVLLEWRTAAALEGLTLTAWVIKYLSIGE